MIPHYDVICTPHEGANAPSFFNKLIETGILAIINSTSGTEATTMT